MLPMLPTLKTSGMTLIAALLLMLSVIAGCCDEHSRKIVIIDHADHGTGFYADHVEIDTSLLGDGVVQSRRPERDLVVL